MINKSHEIGKDRLNYCLNETISIRVVGLNSLNPCDWSPLL